jgi:hypothetical protein
MFKVCRDDPFFSILRALSKPSLIQSGRSPACADAGGENRIDCPVRCGEHRVSSPGAFDKRGATGWEFAPRRMLLCSSGKRMCVRLLCRATGNVATNLLPKQAIDRRRRASKKRYRAAEFRISESSLFEHSGLFVSLW